MRDSDTTGRTTVHMALRALSVVTLTLLPWIAVSDAATPAPPPPPPPPAAGAAQPERTTSVFGDWTVTCTPRAGQPNQCEATTTVQDQQRQLAMVFAIGRVSHDQPMHAVVQVPVNIRTATPVRLVIDADPVSLPFQLCNRLGCFADLELKDDQLIRRLRARSADTPGRAEWRDSVNNEMALPLSTRGFAAAMDSLIAATGK